MRALSAPAPCVLRCAAPLRRGAAPGRAPAPAARPLRAQGGGSSGSGGAAPPEEETDLVSRFVAAIFGKKVLEDPNPAGLKRMTRADWPDQYPALVDEFAAPVEGDAGDVLFLRPLLRQTQVRCARCERTEMRAAESARRTAVGVAAAGAGV
jgi:hypothetical protein